MTFFASYCMFSPLKTQVHTLVQPPPELFECHYNYNQHTSPLLLLNQHPRDPTYITTKDKYRHKYKYKYILISIQLQLTHFNASPVESTPQRISRIKLMPPNRKHVFLFHLHMYQLQPFVNRGKTRCDNIFKINLRPTSYKYIFVIHIIVSFLSFCFTYHW